MPTITLSTKVDGDHQLKLVRHSLKPLFRGLKVKTKIDTAPRGWVQVTVSGEDEEVVLHYLAQRIGVSPTVLEEMKKYSTRKGYITHFNKTELGLDVGISIPNPVDAVISLHHLQAQLVDGRKMALKKISDLFGFVSGLPIIVKITGIDREENSAKAMLSERQLKLYRNWTRSLLDRLIVLGASSSEVREAVRRRISRDVVEIEALSMLEHAIVCKLGTDAVGLIPKIGRRLPNANFAVFEAEEFWTSLEITKFSNLWGCGSITRFRAFSSCCQVDSQEDHKSPEEY